MAEINKESKELYEVLSSKGVPSRNGLIYLSDGLYMNEQGDILEMC